MKKITLLLFSLVFVVSCKKEKTETPTPTPVTPVGDTIRPVITLLGKVKDTISLNVSYADLGATGIDNKDGDISAFIVKTGSVNPSVIGDNQIEYNLRDAAGNYAIKVVRYVHVQNASSFLSGNYNVACSTTTLNPGVDPPINGNLNHTANISVSQTANNSFTISTLNIGPIFVNPYTTIGGNLINVSYYDVNYPKGTCTGTLNASKTSFTIETVAYDYNYMNKIYYCTSVFTKQ